MSYTLTNNVVWLPNSGWDERIHIAANGDLVNVFVIVTERYVISLDTLLNPAAAQALLDHARPYLPERQLLVVNTHADWDHAWGNQLFAGPTAVHPAPIIAHSSGVARYHDAETTELLAQARQDHPEIFGDVRLTEPTLTFSDQLTIDGRDLRLHLFRTPGHTPDHIAVHVPEIDTLFAGDAAELPFPAANDAADLPELRASLRRLASFSAQHVLYCHAPPEIGPQLIHDNLAYFDGVEHACRAALARGFDPARLDDSGIDDATLPATIGCAFADVAPTTGAWAELSAEVHTERHGEQLRMMLMWLRQAD